MADQPQPQNTDAMLAFFLPAKEASALCLPSSVEGCNPEQANDLHLTLAYLGECDELVQKGVDPKAFAQKCAEFAKSMPAMIGTVNGLARFGGDEGDDTQAFVALCDAPSLPDWRHKLTEFLKDCGIEHATDHGFVPHVTLAYVPTDNPNPACAMPNVPVQFDNLCLAWGDTRMEFPLSQPQSEPTTTKTEDKSKHHNPPTLVKKGDVWKDQKSGKLYRRDAEGKWRVVAAIKTAPSTKAAARTDRRAEFKAVNPGKEVERDGIPGIYIAGWASVKKPVDRYGDTINEQAFNNESRTTYFQLNPIILYEHGLDPIVGNKPLGEVVDWKDTEYGLWIKVWIPRPIWEPMLEIYSKIMQGILKTFSIGGIWERQGSEITDADLMEISVVATPAMPYAVFDLAKRFAGMESKGFGQRKRIIVEALALAALDYWTEQGQRVLGKKNVSRRKKALIVARIARASAQVQKLLS